MSKKKISKIRVISAGSNPDVDSDFNTTVREKAIAHVADLYGENNVANITTFNTLAARGAFKAMCTIYEVPFSQANRIGGLIPNSIEGKEPTIADMYDPESEFYEAAADFRSATSTPEWQYIVEGAKAVEGRNKSTGVHAAGVIISSKPLHDVIPLAVRQDDGKLLTQWEYGELEDLGLIKMDFLGLDTVDLIQHTVENIIKNGKTPPNMIDIVQTDMDDKKTFEMLQRGETIGVFQLASEGVQDLLKRIQADRFEDIVATTALYRPGPMGMDSHIKYADRKNGREDIEPIHPDFQGSPLDDILADTYGLVVYQEQVIRIASEIAGMTLQEGDDLRKAMGKKQRAKMEQMKPKFFDGTEANGYSREAAKTLWDTIEVFAEYGFNKSHSVAYAQMAYKAAYLKAHYPVEFLAASIAQHIHRRDKVVEFLNEAKRLGMTIGVPDINGSDIIVSPDYNNVTDFDIIYGLSGVTAVSEKNAAIIVEERKRNGNYTSVKDLVERCMPLGLTSKRVYQNLAKAGSFDSLGVSRKQVVENIDKIVEDVKKTEDRGLSLFDMFDAAEENESLNSDNLLVGEDYPYVDMLKHEADMIGQFISAHPLDRMGKGAGALRTSTIADLKKSSRTKKATIIAALTNITVKKTRRGGKSIMVDIDDNTGSMQGFMSQQIVKGLDKEERRKTIKQLYETGQTVVPDNARKLVCDPSVLPIPALETNNIYILHLTYRPATEEQSENIRVHDIRPLYLADDGRLPIRIRIDDTTPRGKKLRALLPKSLDHKMPGDYPIYVASYDAHEAIETVNEDHLYKAAIAVMDKDARDGVKYTQEVSSANDQQNTTLDGGTADIGKAKKTVTEAAIVRSWPPSLQGVAAPAEPKEQHREMFFEERYDAIAELDYEDTGYRADKTTAVKQGIEKYVGLENYDFGIFDPQVLDD